MSKLSTSHFGFKGRKREREHSCRNLPREGHRRRMEAQFLFKSSITLHMCIRLFNYNLWVMEKLKLIYATIIRHYVSLKFKTKVKTISVSFYTCILESLMIRLYSANWYVHSLNFYIYCHYRMLTLGHKKLKLNFLFC